MTRFRSRRGMASALIILLLVLLIFFGVLSLVTSAADLRLSHKRADWNQSYYLADAQASALLADLDQYCRTLALDKLQTDSLAGLLEQRLAKGTGVQEYAVARAGVGQGIVLTVLVTTAENQAQGIQMQLRVKTGVLAANAGSRLTVESWTQWQQPFQYDGTDGGVWKG